MDSSNLEAELDAAVSDPARKAIVNALDQAYAVRGATHDPTVGDDNQVFGLVLYKSAVYFLKKFVEEDGRAEGLTLFEPGQMFAVRADRFVLAPYRLPRRPVASVGEVFPYNQNGAGELAKWNYERYRQVSIFRDDHGPRIGIVIAHTGNPDAGLTSVSLREPVDQRNGRITEWGYKEHLWPQRGEDSDDGTAFFPPEEPIDEPPIDMKVRPDISTNESEGDSEREHPATGSDES